MTYSDIHLAVQDSIAVVTLARPDRLNAYTPDMGDELVRALRDQLADDRVRAIIVTGMGRGFCAGADRDFIAGQRGRCGHRLGEEPFLTGFAQDIAQAEKPMIAAVNGPAVGIGATMTLPFDVRLASDTASFGFPFARLGLMPGMGASYLLPTLVGRQKAREILLGGAGVDAAEALRIGLVSEVVAPADLLPRALSLAGALSGGNSAAIAAMKRALGAVDRDAMADAMARESREISLLAGIRTPPADTRGPTRTEDGKPDAP